MNEIQIDGQTSNDEQPVFIFAHGAGTGMQHPFMETVAQGLASRGIQIVRFNFPYMIRQVTEGKKFPPDRTPKLLAAYEDILATHAPKGAVIGGKSMGGRIASLLSEHEKVKGIACLGFPFHPPGKPEKMKGEHLAQLDKPCLILQGERDTFGQREEVMAMQLSQQVTLHFLPDGDHSFKPRKSSGITEQDNLESVIELLSQWIWEVGV